MSKEKKPWFKGGVHFTCQPGCRRCCGGAPGDVWVTEEEIEKIAKYKGLSKKKFEAEFVRRKNGGRASLKERSNYDCILLDDHGCSVYPVRPKQCVDYPFWPEVMDSRQSWKEERPQCPGIGEGTLHDADKISKILKTQQSEHARQDPDEKDQA